MPNNFLLKIILILLACGQVEKSYSQSQEIQLANEYWNKGEKEKAYQTYKALSKNPDNLESIHSSYLNVLIELAKYKEAAEHTERVIKKEPLILTYKLDLGYVYLKSGDLARADRHFRELIKQQAQEPFTIKSLAEYFIVKSIPEYAEAAFREARAAVGDNTIFALELANALRIQGKKKEMVEEYLNYVTETPGNTNYVKNLLQYLLTRPEEQDDLQKILITRVQKFPDSEVFADLLTWTYFQQKNFYGAFIQSRAFDRRFGRGNPVKSYELAQIAFNNQDYEIAGRCYEFIIKEFPRSDVYLNARLGFIRSSEARVKKKFPINTDSVRIVIAQYQSFRRQFPDNIISFEAQINSARLFAFYLNQLDSASSLLDELVSNARANAAVRARARLELGDIYLIRNEPWEATLLFSQVEKMQKDSPLGYEAKLRNAKLSYFRGDFALAEEHLDILEKATSREIANDALDLSLKISENTMADSLGYALRVYAAAELLLYQNKREEALQILNLIKSEKKPAKVHISTVISSILETELFQRKQDGDTLIITLSGEILNKPITDDVYWLEAGIRRKAGQFTIAADLLKRISDEYPLDILADDAFFTRAEIIEQDILDKESAKELYRQFLVTFPGSVYTAEARKRYRQLRGDFNQLPLN
ncbi:MAG: tetratricopeptide repeat protein [Cyclobacteriaceae bacterium]